MAQRICREFEIGLIKMKFVFLGFTALFEIGSLICGAAPSSHALIAGRAIAGVGAAGIVNGGITIVSGAVPLEKNPSMRSKKLSRLIADSL